MALRPVGQKAGFQRKQFPEVRTLSQMVVEGNANAIHFSGRNHSAQPCAKPSHPHWASGSRSEKRGAQHWDPFDKNRLPTGKSFSTYRHAPKCLWKGEGNAIHRPVRDHRAQAHSEPFPHPGGFASGSSTQTKPARRPPGAKTASDEKYALAVENLSQVGAAR